MLPYRNAMASGDFLEGAAGNAMAQPKLIDRFTMLPIGQYDDNSLTLAWPGMVNPAIELGRGQFQDGANEDLMRGLRK